MMMIMMLLVNTLPTERKNEIDLNYNAIILGVNCTVWNNIVAGFSLVNGSNLKIEIKFSTNK